MKYKTLCRILIRLLAVHMFGFAASYAVQIAVGTVIGLLEPTSRSYVFMLISYGPYAMGFLASGFMLWLAADWITNKIIPSNRPYCHECGYELTNAASTACPECGTDFRLPAALQPYH